MQPPMKTLDSGSKSWNKSDYEILTRPGDREYYYNKITKESTFIKPDVLKSMDEEFESDPWIECKSRKGKVFYHNTITGESKWTKPMIAERKEDKPWMSGIGTDMKISNYEASKYLLDRLMDQYNILSVKEAFYKLATEPIFRAINEQNRKTLIKEYLDHREKNANAEEISKQSYYKEEICKIRVEVGNFFEFNDIFGKHPYYTKINDKFSCYETYMEKYTGGTKAVRLEKAFEDLGVGLDTSVVDIFDLKELGHFDKKTVLLCFSKYFRKLEKEHLCNIEHRKKEMASKLCRQKEAFGSLLRDLYEKGLIYYKMKFKDAFHLFKTSEEFLGLLGDRESPKELYFDFINELETRLKRYERGYLGADIDAVDKKAIQRYLKSVAEEKEEGEI